MRKTSIGTRDCIIVILLTVFQLSEDVFLVGSTWRAMKAKDEKMGRGERKGRPGEAKL